MWPARVSCRLGQHVNKNIYLRRSGKIKIQNWFMESFPFSIQSRPQLLQRRAKGFREPSGDPTLPTLEDVFAVLPLTCYRLCTVSRQQTEIIQSGGSRDGGRRDGGGGTARRWRGGRTRDQRAAQEGVVCGERVCGGSVEAKEGRVQFNIDSKNQALNILS